MAVVTAVFLAIAKYGMNSPWHRLVVDAVGVFLVGVLCFVLWQANNTATHTQNHLCAGMAALKTVIVEDYRERLAVIPSVYKDNPALGRERKKLILQRIDQISKINCPGR